MTTTTRHAIEVGDLFYTSWGYDQTNVEFYKVVRTTDHKVELEPIGAKVESDGMTYEMVVPDPDTHRDYDVLISTGRCSPYGKPVRETKLCSVNDDGKSVKLGGSLRMNAYPWTPERGAIHQTAHGFGH